MPREHFYFRAQNVNAQCNSATIRYFPLVFSIHDPEGEVHFTEREHSVPRLSNTMESFQDALLNYEPNYAKICVQPAEWKTTEYRYFDRTISYLSFWFIFALENIEEKSLAR